MVNAHSTLKSIIFDFDGVLADTEPLHFRAFQSILSEEGIHLSEKDYARSYVGLADADCFRAVSYKQKHIFTGLDLNRLIQRKHAWMLQAVESHHVVIPGVVDFVKSLAGRYRLAVASCALRQEIEHVLHVAGLMDTFEMIAAAEDVRVGKPDPSIYLYVLDELNKKEPLLASDCLAIEDTPVGIQAAQQAGMKCVAVATTFRGDRLRTADAIVPSLAQCHVSELAGQLWGESPSGRL
jgi:HAD superfamily hydrolase (TIGR01509 family)